MCPRRSISFQLNSLFDRLPLAVSQLILPDAEQLIQINAQLGAFEAMRLSFQSRQNHALGRAAVSAVLAPRRFEYAAGEAVTDFWEILLFLKYVVVPAQNGGERFVRKILGAAQAMSSTEIKNQRLPR